MKLAAAVLLAVSAVLHLAAFPDHYQAAAYIGVGFVVYAAVASAIALAMWRGVRRAGAAAAAVAGGAVVLYVLARTAGLPGYGESDWVDPIGGFPAGAASVVVEAAVVGLCAAMGYPRAAAWRALHPSRPWRRSTASPAPRARLAPAMRGAAIRRRP